MSVIALNTIGNQDGRLNTPTTNAMFPITRKFTHNAEGFCITL